MRKCGSSVTCSGFLLTFKLFSSERERQEGSEEKERRERGVDRRTKGSRDRNEARGKSRKKANGPRDYAMRDGSGVISTSGNVISVRGEESQ